MRYMKPKTILFSLILLVPLQLRAIEEAKPEAAEQPAEEAQGAEAPASDKQTDQQVRSSRDYVQKSSRLASLKIRMEDSEAEFHKLVKSKEQTSDKVVQREIMDRMLALHKELENFTKEYNSLRMEVLYKFPGQGELTERKFAPVRHRSMDELQKESVLGAKLTAAKRAMDRKYRPFQPEAEAAKTEAKPTQAPVPETSHVVPSDEEPIEKKKLKLEK